jgi:putative methionine-R-sulfoxide reductase with GAF domain
MSTRSSLDRESFQKLLASAFSLQESAMDAQSLSALLELQRSIATGEPDVDRAMHLVADRARNVANATGIAIALRRGDQLVYRAGNGCAISYVGRHMTAILSVSAHKEARGEILRVENAQADARIEAAICRQFEAQALLILPIYDEGAVAGVLEVLFSEPHAFQDREMRTYRLMAGLVGEAVSRAAQIDQKRALATQAATLPHAIEQIASQMQRSTGDGKSMPEPARKHGIRQVCGAATAVAGEWLGVCQPAKAATIIMQRVKRVPLHRLRWNVAVTGVVTALVIATCWIAYRRPASPAGTPSLQGSNTVQKQIPFIPAKPAPSNRASKAQTAVGGAEDAKSPRSAFKRVRVGPNEIDYIAEDVTMRHFTTKPALLRVRGGYKEVNIGEDVTVRALLRPN